MRIDSDGSLLVGTTSSPTTLATTGSVEGFGYDATDFAVISRASGSPLILNRLTDDGVILSIRRNGAAVGSIGSVGGVNIRVGSGEVGLRFDDSSDVITPWNTSTNNARDNAIDLGHGTARFDDIYATNGTIQTSDEREKQDIRDITEAEARVAQACKGLLKAYRWKDAVAEKGDNARIHFGIIAQDLQAAFAAEGLDAGDYAMFIHTTWTDEETGEEKSRMGVRYSELLAFIIAAI